jgi:UDP-3-O-[3-hydroxymyristoyl] glucosamine N-acyltransferase
MGVSVAPAVGKGVRVRVGVTTGVSVGSSGPTTGSVAVGSAVSMAAGVAVGRDVGVRVGNGVQVGNGVTVGSGGPGRATRIRLMTMLPTRTTLISQKMIWLQLLLCFFRLLTTTYLLRIGL